MRMSKLFVSILLSLLILLNYTVQAFAENYKYKLYDPETNQIYYASMMTMGGVNGNPNCYYLGLYSSGIACVILPKTNKNESDLIGGEALGLKGKTYKWREINPNTYYREVNFIINERKEQGKEIWQEYFK